MVRYSPGRCGSNLWFETRSLWFETRSLVDFGATISRCAHTSYPGATAPRVKHPRRSHFLGDESRSFIVLPPAALGHPHTRGR
jgi:hypothetical protein